MRKNKQNTLFFNKLRDDSCGRLPKWQLEQHLHIVSDRFDAVDDCRNGSWNSQATECRNRFPLWTIAEMAVGTAVTGTDANGELLWTIAEMAVGTAPMLSSSILIWLWTIAEMAVGTAWSRTNLNGLWLWTIAEMAVGTATTMLVCPIQSCGRLPKWQLEQPPLVLCA